MKRKRIRRDTFEIRWMIRRDMDEVLEIENAVFDAPWQESDYVKRLRQRNCIGMVVDDGKRVVGFMVYELHRKKLHVLNLAVHPDWQGKGLGRSMVERLAEKLSTQRRMRIVLEVRETNLNAQQFFRHCGFRATAIFHDHFDNCDEDAYQMEYRHRSKSQSVLRKDFVFSE